MIKFHGSYFYVFYEIEDTSVKWNSIWKINNKNKDSSLRPGFNPRSGHTNDFKNGTWYLFP